MDHLQRTLGHSLLVRRANQVDAQKVFAFIDAVRSEHGYLSRVQNEIAADQLEALYDGSNGIFLLLECRGLLVGTIAGRVLPGSEIELQKFYLAPEHRGQGLGSTVCSELIRGFFSLGYRAIVLETNRRFQGANRMYRAMGFVTTTVTQESAVAENVWMRLKA